MAYDKVVDSASLDSKLTQVADYSALDYSIVNGAEQGFQYELVNAFASSLDMEVEWKLENDLAKSIEMLNNGDVDLIARPIPVTTEMREQVLFSKPILQTRKVLVQRKVEYNDSIEPIRDQLELAGKTIYVPSNICKTVSLRTRKIKDGRMLFYYLDYYPSLM